MKRNVGFFLRAKTLLVGGTLVLAAMMLTSGTASADPRNFVVENDGAHSIYSLFVSPAYSDRWGPDVLGADMLAPGDTTVISFNGPLNTCEYDVKIQYVDRSQQHWWDVDLCSTDFLRADY